MKALARSYFSLTQGIPTKNLFDSETAKFTGEYTVNTSISKPTLVFKSDEYYYMDGYSMTITDATTGV